MGSATHIRHKAGRLCGDLEKFQKHIDSVASSNNVKPCEVCGLDCYTTCGLFKRAPYHFSPQKGSHKSKTCVAQYHSGHFFGLTHEDINMYGKRKKDWKAPTVLAKRSNKKLIWMITYDNSKQPK